MSCMNHAAVEASPGIDRTATGVTINGHREKQRRARETLGRLQCCAWAPSHGEALGQQSGSGPGRFRMGSGPGICEQLQEPMTIKRLGWVGWELSNNSTNPTLEQSVTVRGLPVPKLRCYFHP